MSRQAQVGAFALIALLMLFGIFYVITNFGTRLSGYRFGVHFASAAGLHSGAQVYFSGVNVGTVDSITLLPDNSVDVILAINRDVDIPVASKFLIQAPLTGDPNMIIVPPAPPRYPPGYVGPTPPPPPVLPRTVLPVADQPEGTNVATIGDLLQEGQGEIKQLGTLLADLQRREPALLNAMQQTVNNANQLTQTANHAIASMTAQMQSSLAEASSNIVALTQTLNETTQLNAPHLNSIIAQLDSSSQALNTSMQSLQGLATNPNLKQNLIDTTHNVAQSTQTIASILGDLHTITGDRQTQAQFRNAVANVDATMQRANSLLGQLGGKSSVYGVDPGATPFPIASPSVAPAGAGNAVPNAPTPQQIHLKSRLTSLAANLVAIQIRVAGLSQQTVCCPNPLLSNDRGPATDMNAVVFPGGKTSFLVGANDIGNHTTANAALLDAIAPSLRVGGGVLYSQPGVLGQYNAKLFGVDARLYDLRRPDLDVYGNLNVSKNLQLFLGERAANHIEHRFTYGVQAQFP